MMALTPERDATILSAVELLRRSGQELGGLLCDTDRNHKFRLGLKGIKGQAMVSQHMYED
jgi:hypothetical protein